MDNTNSKRNILQKIRKAMAQKSPLPYPSLDQEKSIFPIPEQSLEELFAVKFTDNGGSFIFSESRVEFKDQLSRIINNQNIRNVHCWNKDLYNYLTQHDLRQISYGRMLDKAGATMIRAHRLIARTGSIMIHSGQAHQHILPSNMHYLFVVAKISELLFDLQDAVKLIKNMEAKDKAMISFINGPSHTFIRAGVKTMHLPQLEHLVLFLIDDVGY